MELPNHKIVVFVFLLGFFGFFFWPRFISPKVELYRKEKTLIELQRDYTNVLTGLARIDSGFYGWETLEDGGVASFSAGTKTGLGLVEKRIVFWQKKSVPDDLKKQADLNYEALLKAKELLLYFDERLVYWQKIETIIDFLKKDLEEFGSRGYSEIVDKPELIEKRREEVERLSRALATIEAPQEFGQFNERLRKTIRAGVDFWANNEIAVERRTPTIYSQSFWVLKRDWDELVQIGERNFNLGQDDDFQMLREELGAKIRQLSLIFKR